MDTSTINWPDGASVYKNGKFYSLSGKPVGGVAMDSATHNEDFSPEVKAKIRRAKKKLAKDADEDALAELRVALLFPTLKAMALDGVEEEQAAQDEELRRGEVTGNEAEDADTSFEDSIRASAKASTDYWRKAKKVKPSATFERVRNTNKPVAVDHVAANAKKAKSYSMFDTAKAILKRQRKSA